MTACVKYVKYDFIHELVKTINNITFKMLSSEIM